MKMKMSVSQFWRLIQLGTALAVPMALAAATTNPPPQELSAALWRLQEQLNEQTRRLDRLYKAIGPHLAELEEQAAAVEKQQQEDKALAMERIADLETPDLSRQGCMNPAAAEFAVITSTGGLRLYDAQGKAGKEFKASGETVACAAFSPNGATLLAGTAKGALLAWDVASGRSAVVAANVGAAVGRVAWLGKDKLAWAINVNYWEGGKPTHQDKPAGAVLARGTGQVLWRFKANVIERYVTLGGSADGQRLAVMEIPGQPRGVFLLGGVDGQVLLTCYDQKEGHTPLSLALSPDSRTLAVGYAPYDIILWDARTGEPLKRLKGHGNWVVSLAFSADSKRLISGAGDSTARVWEVPSGKEIGRLRFGDASSYTHAVGLSPQGDVAFALVEPGHLVLARVPTAK